MLGAVLTVHYFLSLTFREHFNIYYVVAIRNFESWIDFILRKVPWEKYVSLLCTCEIGNVGKVQEV